MTRDEKNKLTRGALQDAAQGAARDAARPTPRSSLCPVLRPALCRAAVLPLCGLLAFCLPQRVAADVFSFRADKMAGGRATGKEVTVLSGNAQVKSDNLVLRADRIEMYGADNDIVECYGNVSGEESEKQIYFKTDSLVYDRKSKIAKLSGNSTLEDKKNEVVARSRYIEYDDDKEIAVFQISVRLFKEKMVCRSEYAIYRRQQELLDLSGFPTVYKEEDEFHADRIRVDLDTDDVIMDGSISGTLRSN